MTWLCAVDDGLRFDVSHDTVGDRGSPETEIFEAVDYQSLTL